MCGERDREEAGNTRTPTRGQADTVWTVTREHNILLEWKNGRGWECLSYKISKCWQ